MSKAIRVTLPHRAGFVAALSLFAACDQTAFPQESPARLIRDTEALTPKEELKRLHVPDGFTAELFAAEPMINKPINLAFDKRGRLWVSSTTEYPYAAPTNRWADAQGSRVRDSRDAIKILEDTNSDGRADKVTTFADGLNVPTGVLPWHRPEHKSGCIAWSIPNIWYFADTDGDGKCDLREVLFGPLGYERDTHGMCSSFRLGPDGWVYATHGFNNTSHFKVRPENLRAAKPGDPGTELTLNSGNVFRFRPDGSRIEIWSWGQVNPFGLVFDARGNLYSADCHSAPIYQLLHGAYYPSFGKPDDGLGFGPTMMSHHHGSTGICGLEYVENDVWGPAWNHHMLVCNPVTSRVNHDAILFRGSTPVAKEQADFVTSDDLWFRPVDLRLGPDSALYIADFYNRIIGHYEVPLNHPGRDRERGRIWRVTRTGAQPAQPATQRLWETHRGESGSDLKTGFASADESERCQLAAILRERPAWDDDVRALMHSALADKSPHVQRAAAAALQQHPALDSLAPLLSLFAGIPAEDTHLRHVARLALREQLKLPGAFAALDLWLSQHKVSVETLAGLVAISDAVATPEAAAHVLRRFRTGPDAGAEQIIKRLSHVARYGDTATLAGALEFARGCFAADKFAQVDAVQAICNGLAERSALTNAALLAWAQNLAEDLLTSLASAPAPDWFVRPLNGGESRYVNPWVLQTRTRRDGREVTVISSLGLGGRDAEQRTGILRSKSFAAPPKLTFWLCGHRGFPTAPAHDKNFVRLVDAATGAMLKQSFPPRSDVCQSVAWDLSAFAGRAVRLEIVDGDDGRAYAWLGVTGIDPPVVSVERFGSDKRVHKALATLAEILRFTAPVGLRQKLAVYLPSHAAPVTPAISDEERAKLDTIIRARVAAFATAK
ncbi:MAG TPA: PVC-type heme-binding CxxCH protein, partial [Verrucomicrobiae bacterium]